MAVSSTDALLPLDTEERLEKFTELVATAIANAESREARAVLTEEQAALRRVATLAAQGASPRDLFEAVAEEVGSLLPVVSATMGRFEPDDSVITVASWSSTEVAFRTGVRWPTEGTNVAWIVLQTGRAARVDDFSAATDPIGVAAREAGYKSAVGSPIVVEGRLWGLISATSTEGPLPPGIEARLASFTELVATAIANAKSQNALEQLADEQAALRRIATLVAKGILPVEVFAAVAEEVAAAFRAITGVLRFEHDPPGVVLVGAWKAIDPIGTRWDIDDLLEAAEVYRTGRSARVNRADWTSVGGAVGEAVRRLGIVSTVACPIIVEGSLWGVITVNAGEELPPDTEQRLEKFTELVTTAIANAEGKSALAASRRRIVAASDEARRRIERDLHDGTQQRLVSLGLAVRAAEANLAPERQDVQDQLSRVASGLVHAVEDLQEISRGIHPAILSKGGLGPALQTLAHRSAIPVDLDITTDVRLAEPIEAAAYFVASEALANAAKHSDATRIDVSLEHRDGNLLLSVRDDGVGGADGARGSGIVGLNDRVEAIGGSLHVESRPGEGTQVVAQLPLELEQPV
jgi:signal transduction histidine kinase